MYTHVSFATHRGGGRPTWCIITWHGWCIISRDICIYSHNLGILAQVSVCCLVWGGPSRCTLVYYHVFIRSLLVYHHSDHTFGVLPRVSFVLAVGVLPQFRSLRSHFAMDLTKLIPTDTSAFASFDAIREFSKLPPSTWTSARRDHLPRSDQRMRQGRCT